MVEASKNDKELILSFSDEESNTIGLDSKKDYILTKAKEGIWIMVENGEKKLVDDVEEKLIEKIKKMSLSERVEGVFETKLNEDESKKLMEMLNENKIEKFKLNESYKKAVYQLKDSENTTFENKEKPFHEYTLEKDGFAVVKNEARAKELSNRLSKKIKDGEIKGTRSFSGEFFIINFPLLEKSQEKILIELKKTKTSDLETLSKETTLTKTLCRIALEFLKEDGQLIEKRKGNYQYIE